MPANGNNDLGCLRRGLERPVVTVPYPTLSKAHPCGRMDMAGSDSNGVSAMPAPILSPPQLPARPSARLAWHHLAPVALS